MTKQDEPVGKKVAWRPLPGSQTIVMQNTWIFEILYHGTRGPGKSDTLLMDFAQFVGKGFGLQYKGVIFRQTFPQLEDLITKSKRWFPLIFPNAKWNGSAYKWVFPDGEELLFRQFNKADDYWKYHGQEFQFIGWDELTNWASLDGYQSMMSCLRTTNKDVPLRVRATTNPYGAGHNIVKFHFELPQKDGIVRKRWYGFTNPLTGKVERHQLTRLCVRGTIYENTILLEAQPNYIAQLKAQADNPAKLAAWLEGSWEIVSGGMFDDVWDKNYHVVRPFKVPASWRMDRSFDWGSSAPFSVGWWAESDGTDFQDGDGNWRSSIRGDLYRVGEWYGWNGKPNKGLRMLAVDISKGIRERELAAWPLRKIYGGPADTSIWDVENGVSYAGDMERKVRLDDGTLTHGCSWTRADKRSGSRKAGWDAIRKMLKNALPTKRKVKEINNETGEEVEVTKTFPREHAGLFVFDNCDQFVRTIPVLPRNEKDLDDVNTEAEDHIGDEVRYKVRSTGNRGSSGRTTGMH